MAILKKLSELKRQNRASPGDLAIIHTGLGNKDYAFEWLDKAYQEHSWVVLYLKKDPLFDPLRSDPRFTDLVRRVGIPS
jgi:hypothetical protein